MGRMKDTDMDTKMKRTAKWLSHFECSVYCSYTPELGSQPVLQNSPRFFVRIFCLQEKGAVSRTM